MWGLIHEYALSGSRAQLGVACLVAWGIASFLFLASSCYPQFVARFAISSLDIEDLMPPEWWFRRSKSAVAKKRLARRLALQAFSEKISSESLISSGTQQDMAIDVSGNTIDRMLVADAAARTTSHIVASANPGAARAFFRGFRTAVLDACLLRRQDRSTSPPRSKHVQAELSFEPLQLHLPAGEINGYHAIIICKSKTAIPKESMDRILFFVDGKACACVAVSRTCIVVSVPIALLLPENSEELKSGQSCSLKIVVLPVDGECSEISGVWNVRITRLSGNAKDQPEPGVHPVVGKKGIVNTLWILSHWWDPSEHQVIQHLAGLRDSNEMEQLNEVVFAPET